MAFSTLLTTKSTTIVNNFTTAFPHKLNERTFLTFKFVELCILASFDNKRSGKLKLDMKWAYVRLQVDLW